jgi:hypothetical protein
MLFTLEIILAIRYLSRFNGPGRFKVVVALIVINAAVTQFGSCAHSWKLLIEHRAAPPDKHSWPLPLMLITKNIAGAIGQTFLVYRYYGLSKSIFLTSVVGLMIIAHLAAGIITAVDYLLHPEFGRALATLARTLSLVFNAAPDFLIPILLIWELRKIKATYSSTYSFIRQIIVNAASSGVSVALVEVLLLVLFWTQSEVVILAWAIVGPLYGITVLINLLVCQRRLTRPTTPTPSKTVDLTTLDTAVRQGSFNPPHRNDHLVCELISPWLEDKN